MSEQTWKGYWRLPEDPSDALPGILHYTTHGNLRLELIGGFNVETQTPLANGVVALGFNGSFPVLHGRCAGQLFTLLEAQATHTSSGFGFGRSGVEEQTIRANRGLQGIHLVDADELVFDSMELEIEYLLGWTARSSMAASIELDKRWTGKQTAVSEPVEDQTAVVDGLVFTLRVPHVQFEIDTAHAANRRSLGTREFAELVVSATSPLSLNELDGIAKSFQDLLTMAALAPAGALRRTLWHKPSEAHPSPNELPRRVQVMGRQIYEPGSATSKIGWNHDYLFTLADVAFADLVPAWLVLHEQVGLPCSMLFGTKYVQDGYTPTRMLTVASAAEGLHRSLHDRQPLTSEAFQAMHATVLAALAGDENKPARALVHLQLKNGLTYYDRLLELAALPDNQAIAKLLPDVKRWATLLKNARNGVAHADDSRPESRPDAALVFWLTEISYLLLCLVLMAELKMPAEIQRKAVEIQPTMHAIREFANASTPDSSKASVEH